MLPHPGLQPISAVSDVPRRAAPSAPVEDFLTTDPTATWMPIRRDRVTAVPV